MDRDLESLSSPVQFTWRRLFITLLLSVAIIGIGSLLVRSYPNSGYSAGYDDVIALGQPSVQAEIAAANGTALPLCTGLHAQTESSSSSPRYERASFVDGCSAAVNHLLDRNIPLE